jgi:hypothetical protein
MFEQLRLMGPTGRSIVLQTHLGREIEKGFLHVGTVFELKQLDGSEKQIPWILSKWDDTSPEYMHHFEHCPFPDKSGWEFWTDRPAGGV